MPQGLPTPASQGQGPPAATANPPATSATPPQPADQGMGTGLNFNPVSNPTHPAHQVAAQHLGQALGHMLTGNHEAANQLLHSAIEHIFVPHREQAAAQQGTAPQPRSGDVANELRTHAGNIRTMRQALRQSMRGTASPKPARKKRTK